MSPRSGPNVCVLEKAIQVCIHIDLKVAGYVPIGTLKLIALGLYSLSHLCRHFETPLSCQCDTKLRSNLFVATAM